MAYKYEGGGANCTCRVKVIAVLDGSFLRGVMRCSIFCGTSHHWGATHLIERMVQGVCINGFGYALRISMSLWGGSHGLLGGLWTHDYYRSDLCWSMVPPEAVKKGKSRGHWETNTYSFCWRFTQFFFSILAVFL